MAILSGVSVGLAGATSTSSCWPSRSSCSSAAGRRTSVETSSTRFFSRVLSQSAIFAAVVVLPAPCRPASSTMAGGCARRLSGRTPSPMTRTSSSWMILISAWPGVRLLWISCPTTCALTSSMKVLTTGSATSASSSAMRTWRRVSAMFSSVSRPRPRRPSTTDARRAESLSNTRWKSLLGPRGSAPHYERRLGDARL